MKSPPPCAAPEVAAPQPERLDMARLAACLLALFVLGAARGAVLATSPADHGRQDRGQKPHGDRPPDRERDRWKWWLYDRAELSITDKQSADIDKIFET